MAECISRNTIRVGKGIIHAPCQKCNFCLQNRRADWSFRLQQEQKNASSSWFITLTYDEANQPLITVDDEVYATLNKTDVQLFLKRLRKANGTFKIKYYFVGEYGGDTYRPHYHAIIFNVQPSTLNQIIKIWGKGFVSVGQVEPASIHYVAKYVLNSHDDWKPLANPFALISQGIGKRYLTVAGHHHKKSLQNFVVNDSGERQRIPRYIKDKIFSYKQKDHLARVALTENDLLYKEALSKVSNEYQSKTLKLEFERNAKHDKIKNKSQIINPNSI